MKRNKFSKALKQLKSTELDERIKSLEESAPTNSIGGVYALNQPGQRLGPYDPPKVFYPDIDGNWPDGIPGTPGETTYVRPPGYWDSGPGSVPAVDWDRQVDLLTERINARLNKLEITDAERNKADLDELRALRFKTLTYHMQPCSQSTNGGK